MRSTRASGNIAQSRFAWAPICVGALERLDRERVLVVHVGRAQRVERARLAAGPRRLPAVDQLVDRLGEAHRTGGVRSARPSSGVEASACRRRGMRPAPRASRPASTAARIAWAMATGSCGAGDRARAQDAVAAELHRERRVARGADARVEDHRDARPLDDQRDVVRVADPHARADRRAERHHRRAADVLEAAGEDRVVVRVGQDGEAVVDELLGGEQQLGRVGQQRAVVADDLELDPVGLERLAGELGRHDRVAGGEAAGGVRQQLDAALVEDVGERAARLRVDPAQRDRDELGARRADRLGERLQPLEAARAEDQARAQRAPAELERRVGDGDLLGPVGPVSVAMSAQPPCMADSASTRSPSLMRRSSHSARGTTSPSTATATPRARASTPRSASSSAIVAPSRSCGSPLT